MPMDWLKTNVSEKLFQQLLDLKEKCQRIILETSGTEEEEVRSCEDEAQRGANRRRCVALPPRMKNILN